MLDIISQGWALLQGFFTFDVIPEAWSKVSNEIYGNPINYLFFKLLCTIFVIAVVLHFARLWQKFVQVSPTLLTAIGVLGTFFGIFYGLADFDSEKISESIPPLLESMKTAFVTSICGMFFGILMRIVRAFSPIRKGKTAKTSEEFIALMNNISESIIGIRQDSNNNHKAVIKELKQFAEDLSQNSTEAIIESLEKVVRDFNEQINEQFGDNFKQLNEAVGKLLDWQKDYKEQVISMQEQFQRSLDSIGEVEKAMVSIKESTEAIPLAMEKLPEIVKTATETLEAFRDMKNEAISAFPTIEENIRKLTSGLASQAETFESALESQKASYQQLEDAYNGLGGKVENAMEKLATQTETSMEQLTEKTQTATQQLAESTQGAVVNMSNEMQTAMEELKQSMKKSIDGATTELRESFIEFDRKAEGAITNMGEIVGSILIAIVEDYLPIAQRLRERLNSVKGRGDN